MSTEESSSANDIHSDEEKFDIDNVTDNVTDNISSDNVTDNSSSDTDNSSSDSSSDSDTDNSLSDNATDNSSSDSATDNSLSDSSSNEYQHIFTTYGQNDDKKVNITFLENDFKIRKNPGVYIQAKYPSTCSRNTPPKPIKLKLLHLKEKYYNNTPKPTLKKFMQKYQNVHGGYKKWVNKITWYTWRDYHANFKRNSVKYNDLKKYVDLHPTTNTMRFYRDPFGIHYGVFPIFEEFLVKFRQIAGKEYEWRSVSWFLTEAKRFVKHKKILGLLKPFMTRQEWKLLKLATMKRTYIYRIMVYLPKKYKF